MRQVATLAAIVCAVSALSGQTGALRRVDFATEIHPLVQTRCAGCHSGDQAQAGFRVDSRERIMRAIIPGDAQQSLLILKVSGQRGTPMPPAGPRLTAEEIATLRNWINQGAPAGSSGAPEPQATPWTPRSPSGTATPAGNPVDHYLDAYFAQKGIQPAGPVSDAVFARRAYFDLHGLPPSPAELAAFLADTKPAKRAALIDRLLAARERYAEHQISFWNDLLRNDEGVVYHGDRKSITAWLLAALSNNMPYDRMVRALLNPVSADDPAGFLTGVNWRGVVSASQSPPMQAAQNSAQVFLGVNLKCAACHDSFVNRWKLRDTFGLAAMFSEKPLELVRCDVPLGRQAEARFPAQELTGSGELPGSRRALAAKWFTRPENGRFARTIVNRYWRLLTGRGIVEPVDDLDSQPWSRDLLDGLAWDFAAHDFDLQYLLKTIMTSKAYQMPPVADDSANEFVFRGPLARRLTAEQFQDSLSAVSGDWRVLTPRNSALASFAREWRLKSDPFSRAMGRPIRDQVYTERATIPSTFQALELSNGPLLSERLERAALAMLGELPAPPANRFDSKLVRSGRIQVDVDISGARELWLVTEDVDSYDPARIVASWEKAELIGPDGRAEPLDGEHPNLTARVPSTLRYSIATKNYTRLRAQIAIDPKSNQSDISPALRFFVFTSKPDQERLVRIEGAPPFEAAPPEKRPQELIARVYRYLLSRDPAEAERSAALRLVAPNGAASAAGLEDLLWALMMSPEFQYIR